MITCRQHEQLPSRMIQSGLVDQKDDTHFSRIDNRTLLKKPVFVEANFCRRVPGDFLTVADAAWNSSILGSSITTTSGPDVTITVSHGALCYQSCKIICC